MNKKLLPEYRAWKAMKARCYSPCNKEVRRYQAIGINVCDRWLDNFGLFFEDMGCRPSSKHSLDRVDNDKGYFKENCRWANASTQSKNRGDFNLIFTLHGESLVLKDWSRRLGIKYNTLWGRIYKYGLSFEDAIKKDPFKRLIRIGSEEKILKDWCEIHAINYQLAVGRIHDGWEPERAILTPKKKQSTTTITETKHETVRDNKRV